MKLVKFNAPPFANATLPRYNLRLTPGRVARGFNNSTVAPVRAPVRTRTSGKRSQSRTETRTVTKRRRRECAEALHGMIKRFFYRVGSRKVPRNISRGVWTVSQQYNVPLNLTFSAGGLQGVWWAGAAGTLPQLTIDSASDTRSTLAKCLCSLNPNQGITGSNVYTNAAIPTDDRFYLDYMQFQLEFSNTTNVPAMLDLYLLKAKVNSSSDPVTEWTNLLGSTALGQSSSLQPVPAGTGASAGVPVINTVGQNPFQLQGFRKMFVKEHFKQFDMAPGSNAMVTYNIGVGRLIDKKYISELLTLNVARITRHIMCVLRGGLAIDKSQATHFPIIAPMQVAMVLNTKYYCHSAGVQRTRNNYVETPNFVTNSALVNTSIMDVVDIVINEAQAN